MTEEKWTGLGTPLLSMLAAESNEIIQVISSVIMITTIRCLIPRL